MTPKYLQCIRFFHQSPITIPSFKNSSKKYNRRHTQALLILTFLWLCLGSMSTQAKSKVAANSKKSLWIIFIFCLRSKNNPKSTNKPSKSDSYRLITEIKLNRMLLTILNLKINNKNLSKNGRKYSKMLKNLNKIKSLKMSTILTLNSIRKLSKSTR